MPNQPWLERKTQVILLPRCIIHMEFIIRFVVLDNGRSGLTVALIM